MPKKSKLDSRLIFTKIPFRDFIKGVHDRHPEIVRGFALPLEKLSPPDEEYLRSYHGTPGIPYKRGNKTEWDAWFSYYKWCQACYLDFGYDYMARLINRVMGKNYSETYVKKKFIELSKAIEEKIIEWEYNQENSE